MLRRSTKRNETKKQKINAPLIRNSEAMAAYHRSSLVPCSARNPFRHASR